MRWFVCGAWALLMLGACSSDESGSTASAGTGAAASHGSTGVGAAAGSAGAGGGNCGPIDGCSKAVEVCEGGQCSCQCVEPTCPADVQKVSPPAKCGAAGENCTFATGC